MTYSYYFPAIKDSAALGWANNLSVQAKDFVSMDVKISVYNLAGSLVGMYICSNFKPTG